MQPEGRLDMTVKEAIIQGKETYLWTPVSGNPFSVDVEFQRRDGVEDQTQLDLYSDDPEEELSDLWGSLHEELNADIDAVTGVYSYDEILD